MTHSCDRTDTAHDSEVRENPLMNYEQRSDKTSSREAAPLNYEVPVSNNLKTGEDEEPRRDKQHWRISNDSVK